MTVIAALGILGIGLWWMISSRSLPATEERNPCGSAPNVYACYRSRITELAASQGIPAALGFVTEVIAREHGTYGFVHHAMHAVGREAYRRTRDPHQTLVYLPPEAHGGQARFHYDGYQHGVAEAFFAAQGGEKTTVALGRELCSLSFDAPSPPTLPRGAEFAAENCFHAIGHALMFAHGNSVALALGGCDTLPQGWQRSQCYYGVFMEVSYSTSPRYDPGRPRPLGETADMVPLCAAMSDPKRVECARLVGRAVLAHDRENVGPAFAHCGQLETGLRESCITEMATIYFPLFFAENFPRMAEACVSAGPAYEELCILAVARGIQQGAHPNGQDTQTAFCDAVAQTFRESCLRVSLEARGLMRSTGR